MDSEEDSQMEKLFVLINDWASAKDTNRWAEFISQYVKHFCIVGN